MAAIIEYPKHVYKQQEDGTLDTEHPVTVRNADEEYAAAVKGYAPVKSVAPPEESVDAVRLSPDFLEFPKHVYKGDPDVKDPDLRVVKNEAEEEAANADGYFSREDTVAGAVDGEDNTPADDAKPKKRGRKSKA